MPRGRKSGIPAGIVGAAAGTVIGGTAGILLSNKKAKKFAGETFSQVKDYALDAFETMNSMADQNNQRLAKVGAKGGKTRGRKSHK
ncbi:MAG TPA: YtxH domain-containing protein [Patescibacteria group bacterium]|nr:YtxH domain-containing protein [Patescibacteria group bacterium]